MKYFWTPPNKTSWLHLKSNSPKTMHGVSQSEWVYFIELTCKQRSGELTARDWGRGAGGLASKLSCGKLRAASLKSCDSAGRRHSEVAGSGPRGGQKPPFSLRSSRMSISMRCQEVGLQSRFWILPRSFYPRLFGVLLSVSNHRRMTGSPREERANAALWSCPLVNVRVRAQEASMTSESRTTQAQPDKGKQKPWKKKNRIWRY